MGNTNSKVPNPADIVEKETTKKAVDQDKEKVEQKKETTKKTTKKNTAAAKSEGVQTYLVDVISIALTNQRVAKYGEVVKEGDLTSDASKLVKKGYIKPVK